MDTRIVQWIARTEKCCYKLLFVNRYLDEVRKECGAEELSSEEDDGSKYTLKLFLMHTE